MASNWYTRKQFLFTFRFRDEPLAVPNYFLKEEANFSNLCEDVPKYINRGMRITKAFNACGVRTPTYNKWVETYNAEIDAGKHDTPLIRLFDKVYDADATLDKTLHDMAMTRIEDGDAKMLHFLMKHRLGYNTQRTELELSNKGDTPFTVNIVGMTDMSAPSTEHSSRDEFMEKCDERDREELYSTSDKLFDENGEVTPE